MAVPNSSYDQLSAITQKHFMPILADNIFTSIPLLSRLQKKSKKVDGGTSVVLPLGYATASASGWYQGAETLSLVDNDVITSAEFDWKQIRSSVIISRLDELKNQGKAQVLDFVKQKVQIAEKTLRNTLAVGLFNTGASSNAILGARSFVSTSNTYGGISQSTYSWWQGNVDASTTSLSISALQGLYGDCSEIPDVPTVAITTQDIYDDYYSLLQPQQRFQDMESAKGGFTSLMFNGLPILVDSNCPSGYLYLFNEDYLHFIVHPEENFRFEPFQKPINQNIKVGHIFLQCVFASNQNRAHGAFTSLV